MITGFYVADLAQRDKKEAAEAFLLGIHESNAMGKDSGKWEFHEYANGKTFEPEGVSYQGWSGAAAIMGHQALQGKKIFHF